MSQCRVGEDSNSFSNNTNSFNIVNNFGSADERAERAEILHSNHKYGTMILESTGSRGWEAGSSEQSNIGVGSTVFATGNPIIQPCFATEIRGSAKFTSSEK